MALLQFILEQLLGYLFYAMLCVPFVTWAGVVTYRGTAGSSSGYPGHAVAFWFLGLPGGLIAYGVLRGFEVADPANPYAVDEWGQILFLSTMPAAGLILGCILGMIVGASERERI
jgi:hypothetical protein